MKETEILRGLGKAKAKMKSFADGLVPDDSFASLVQNANTNANAAAGIKEAAATAPATTLAPTQPIAEEPSIGGFMRSLVPGFNSLRDGNKAVASGANNFAAGTAFMNGPGTGTSDSIHGVSLSHGEAVLPAKTVQAVGSQNLARLIEQTNGKPPKGLRAQGHYEDGTVPDLELSTAGNSPYAQQARAAQAAPGAPAAELAPNAPGAAAEPASPRSLRGDATRFATNAKNYVTGSAPSVAPAADTAVSAATRVARAAGGLTRLAAPLAYAAPIAGFGDYKIADPSNPSQPNPREGWDGVKQGAVEAGLDSISGIAKTADAAAGIFGFKPGLRQAFDNKVQADIGNQLVRPEPPAPPPVAPPPTPATERAQGQEDSATQQPWAGRAVTDMNPDQVQEINKGINNGSITSQTLRDGQGFVTRSDGKAGQFFDSPPPEAATQAPPQTLQSGNRSGGSDGLDAQYTAQREKAMQLINSHNASGLRAGMAMLESANSGASNLAMKRMEIQLNSMKYNTELSDKGQASMDAIVKLLPGMQTSDGKNTVDDTARQANYKEWLATQNFVDNGPGGTGQPLPKLMATDPARARQLLAAHQQEFDDYETHNKYASGNVFGRAMGPGATGLQRAKLSDPAWSDTLHGVSVLDNMISHVAQIGFGPASRTINYTDQDGSVRAIPLRTLLQQSRNPAATIAQLQQKGANIPQHIIDEALNGK
jgi:hypothetical protein